MLKQTYIRTTRLLFLGECLIKMHDLVLEIVFIICIIQVCINIHKQHKEHPTNEKRMVLNEIKHICAQS